MLCLAPDPRRHSDELFELIRVCNGISPELSRGRYVNHSHYDWRTSRIGLVDGRIVAHYGVWGYDMRIGAARLRTAGVGAVATHPDFRGRGLSSELIADCLDAMRSAGYAMTRLSGIPNFYHKFGYVRAWAENVFTAPIGEMPAPPKARLCRCPPTALVRFAAAYNRQYRLAAGTAVRPTFRVSAKVVADYEMVRWNRANGSPAGYVLVKAEPDTRQLRCCEYVGDAADALGVLGAIGRKANCERVLFESIPAGSELIRLLKRGNCEARTAFIRSGGSMIRLVSLPSALCAMRREFERLLKRSELAKWRGRLSIRCEREAATLRIRDGRVAVEEGASPAHGIRGGHAIAQLLLGTDEPGETVESGGLRVRGDARRLLPVLFPRRDPVLSFADRF